MNAQPCVPHDDPVPAKWKTRWYHFRYRLTDLFSRLLRMPRPIEVNQALKNQQWRSLQHGKEEGLGRCPEHPNDAPMMNLHSGNYRCGACWAVSYFRTIDAGPVTDPHILPAKRYIDMRGQGAGPSTATLAAIPKWLVRLQEKPKGEQ